MERGIGVAASANHLWSRHLPMSSGSCRDKRLVKSSREEKREEKKKRWCITVLPNRQHQLPAPGAIGMVNRRPRTTDLKDCLLYTSDAADE